MNVAITGGTGFIGKHLINYLSGNVKNKIFVLALPEENNPFATKSNVVFIPTDFSKDSLTNCLQGVDQIIHLAGIRMPRSTDYTGIEYFFNANIKLVEDIALSAIYCNVKRIIFSSSIAVYGDADLNEGITENFTPNPLNNYGLSKLIGEKILNIFANTSEIEAVSLRFSQIFGKGERADLIMANFINKCMHNEDILINSSGFHERDYLYVFDALRAIEHVINAKSISGSFNIGSNSSVSAFKIATTIKAALHSSSSIITSPKPDHIKKLFMSTSKIKQVLGWDPLWNIESAIKEMSE